MITVKSEFSLRMDDDGTIVITISGDQESNQNFFHRRKELLRTVVGVFLLDQKSDEGDPPSNVYETITTVHREGVTTVTVDVISYSNLLKYLAIGALIFLVVGTFLYFSL